MMTVLARREEYRRFAIAGNVFINGAVVHLVAVGETFGMATRIIREAGHVFAKAGGGALEDLVRFVAAAHDDFVRLLEIPAHAALGAVNAKVQTAFPTGSDLRNGSVGVGAVDEAVFRAAAIPKTAFIYAVSFYNSTGGTFKWNRVVGAM